MPWVGIRYDIACIGRRSERDATPVASWVQAECQETAERGVPGEACQQCLNEPCVSACAVAAGKEQSRKSRTPLT